VKITLLEKIGEIESMEIIKKCSLVVMCFVFISSVFSGCYNYVELDRQFIVLGFVVDYDEESNEYIYSVEISEDEGEGSDLIKRTETSRGVTLLEAKKKMIDEAGVMPYGGHVIVCVISERLAQRGISGVLNTLSASTQMRADINIIICKNDSIGDVFEIDNLLLDSPSLHLENMLDLFKQSSKFPNSPMFRVIKDISSNEISLILPYIEVIESKNIDEATEEDSTDDQEESDDEDSSEDSSQESPHLVVKSDGCAIFNGDQMIGKLDGDESQAVMIIRRQVPRHYAITLDEEKLPKCSMEVVYSDFTIDPIINNDDVKIQIDLYLEGDIRDIQSETDYINIEKKVEVEEGYEKMISEKIYSTIEKLQKDYNTDIFGFGGFVHRKYPTFWKNNKDNWEEVFTNAEIDISVDVLIQTSGLTIDPIEVGR